MSAELHVTFNLKGSAESEFLLNEIIARFAELKEAGALDEASHLVSYTVTGTMKHWED